MYIRTPKRYRSTPRRSVLSCRRLLFIFLLLMFIGIGIFIYNNAAIIQPQIAEVVQGVVDSAEAQLATMSAPEPTATADPSTNIINGDNSWGRGNISEAITYYQQVLPSVPNEVGVYQRLTIGLITRGGGETALEYAERTVTADPFSADAWATRALAYSWEGDYEQGIVSAQQALDLDEDHAAALAYLAYSYWQGGRSALADSRATQAIALDPDRFEGYWVRGLVRENDLLDIEGARSDYETAYSLAVEQNPALAGVVATGLARVLVRPEYNQVGEAVAVLEDARSRDPDNVEVLYTLGVLNFSNLGEYGQAQGPLEDCVDVDEDNYLCLYMLGRTLDRLDDQEGALAAFTAAVDYGTPWARTYWWAANMEILLGSCNNAVPLLETGYRMVAPGDLPANDEPDELLQDAFVTRMNDCRVPIPGGFAPQPEAEETAEAAEG